MRWGKTAYTITASHHLHGPTSWTTCHFKTDAEAHEALMREATGWDDRYTVTLTVAETGEVLGTLAGAR